MLPEGYGYQAALIDFLYMANALWTVDDAVKKFMIRRALTSARLTIGHGIHDGPERRDGLIRLLDPERGRNISVRTNQDNLIPMRS